MCVWCFACFVVVVAAGLFLFVVVVVVSRGPKEFHICFLYFFKLLCFHLFCWCYTPQIITETHKNMYYTIYRYLGGTAATVGMGGWGVKKLLGDGCKVSENCSEKGVNCQNASLGVWGIGTETFPYPTTGTGRTT